MNMTKEKERELAFLYWLLVTSEIEGDYGLADLIGNMIKRLTRKKEEI